MTYSVCYTRSTIESWQPEPETSFTKTEDSHNRKSPGTIRREHGAISV